MDTLKSAAFDRQIACLGSAGAKDRSVELLQQLFSGIIAADFRVVNELNSLGFHLAQAPQDDLFFIELHVGYAIHEQAAGTIGAFKNSDGMPDPVQLSGSA